ncbi:unnamed protein product [Acanthoscelides obtectus]|uniref:Uncharacterized protein n=1 Tax=Acanthoscelides obtectus TaxID=200917 RepID=A0A9P0LZ90_ACAOB|nr:unnamed protein product [Acanthoscelides obtectus]CAK1669086.1 Protein ZBED8 [Acanthoscelides obtectus]
MSHWEKEQERLLKLWEEVGAEDSENEQLEQEAASGSEAEENNSERSTNSDTEQEIDEEDILHLSEATTCTSNDIYMGKDGVTKWSKTCGNLAVKTRAGRIKLDKTGNHHTGVSQHLKASFKIAFMIAKQKKSHTFGEELITPCVLKATQMILGEDAEQKMKSISLLNNTVKRRIDDIAADIKSQIINKVKLSPFFVISCDESTDIANCAQLIVYIRYIG